MCAHATIKSPRFNVAWHKKKFCIFSKRFIKMALRPIPMKDSLLKEGNLHWVYNKRFWPTKKKNKKKEPKKTMRKRNQENGRKSMRNTQWTRTAQRQKPMNECQNVKTKAKRVQGTMAQRGTLIEVECNTISKFMGFYLCHVLSQYSRQQYTRAYKRPTESCCLYELRSGKSVKQLGFK